MTRYQSTSPVLEQEEEAWWAEYGDLEEAFCWVQDPFVQRFLRGAYLRRALANVRPGDSVLEVGCGTGWLTLLLARVGAGDVVGVDVSGAQIARARLAAARAGLSGRVRFVEGGEEALGAQVGGRFDVVVFHAVLHHLSTDEISRVLDQSVGLLKPGGRLVAVEPVHDPRDAPAPAPAPALSPSLRPLQWLRWLQAAPMVLHRRRLRAIGPAEADARSRLEGRSWARPPGGPSPKEHPFAPGELDAMLGRRAQVEVVTPCLGAAHLVAQELLLARLSQPRLWGAAMPAVLWVARALDRRLLKLTSLPTTMWVFHLYVATLGPTPETRR